MIWSVLCTCFATILSLLYANRSRSIDGDLRIQEKTLIRTLGETSDPDSLAKLLTALAAVRGATTPWYERTISVVGVVAFFSMTIATGFQTFSAASREVKQEQLKVELVELEEELAAADKFLEEMARAALARSIDPRRISRDERNVLRYRLTSIQSRKSQDATAIREGLALAMTLSDYESAAEFVDRNWNLLDETIPADRVSLAEYYYLVGSHGAARDIASDLELNRTLPPQVEKRLIVLRAALDFTFDDQVRELARLLAVNPEEAHRILRNDVSKLKEATGVEQ